MKPSLCKKILLYCIFWTCSGIAHGQQIDIELVRTLTSYLESKGLVAFMQAAGDNHWKAPAIPSRWHVENVAPKSIIAIEEEARTFGKAVEARASAFVPQLLSAGEPNDIFQKSEALLRLSEWLSTSESYGNLILGARCKDIASIGLARLVADLGVPMERTANLLTALSPPSPSIRARVLNQEAGAQLFSPSSTQAELEAVWRTGVLLLLEKSNPKIKEAVLSGSGTMLIDTPIMRSHLAFFADDQRPNPPTTAKLWNSKTHERMVLGLDVPNARKLLALARFREAVKAFPIKPTYANHQFSSDGEAAFDEAWQPHATRETHALFALAWRTYDLIQKGKFVDEDSGTEAK